MSENLIIVDITDKEYIKLGQMSEQVEIKGDGKVVVKNGSSKSRLWNLINDLKEIVNTTASSKVVSCGALNPGQEHVDEYEIQNMKAACLKVVETFDTERQTGDTVNNAFLYQNKNSCNLKLTFTNTLDLPIIDIKATREMPEILQDIEILSPNLGNADLKEEGGKRVLLWEIGSLAGKETAELNVKCLGTVNDRNTQSLGALKVLYLINSYKLTLMDPEVRGLTDSMSGVSRDEGTNPGTWDYNVEFNNDSEFMVRLEDVKVSHKIATGSEIVVSETPNVELKPGNAWDFDFKLEEENVPELESKIEFTPLFELITRVIGEINKESTIYPVLASEVHKAIIPPEVGAYANTDMKIENSIPNTGTSSIDALQISDEIPPDFMPPLVKEIKLIVTNPEGSIEIQDRQEFVKKFVIEPEDQNPDTKHTISVDLHGLEKQLPPNSKLVMSYPLLAKNPKPEVRYNTPVEIKANAPRRGLDLVISPPEEPVIKIKYIQRKLKTLKSIKPGSVEGEFSISVRIQNKGDVELENIVVKDKIPAGFTLTDFNPEDLKYEINKIGEESELNVEIVELKGNESITINYSCQGSGDYPRGEPQVIVKGRGGVGASKAVSIAGEPSKTPVTKVSPTKQAQLLEVFDNIFKKLKEGIKGTQLGMILDEAKDTLPPGPAVHQFKNFALEVKAHGDKMIVGIVADGIEAKLKEFKEKYM